MMLYITRVHPSTFCYYRLKQHSNLLKVTLLLSVISGIVTVLLHPTSKIFPFFDFTFTIRQSFF